MNNPERSTAEQRALDVLRGYVNHNGDHAQHRPQQEEMTAAVAASLEHNHNLICQAGTGTGKSIGYLAAIYASGRRTVISTATKALGEQLIGTDIPALDAYLADTGRRPMSYTLLKGRNNYACLMKVDQINRLGDEETPVTSQEELDLGIEIAEPEVAQTEAPSGEIEDYKALLEWVKDTDSGDRTDAPPASDWAWEQISISASACLGASNCPFAGQCFSEAAREAAKSVDITVTNHALLAADMKNDSPLLGGFDAIVVDEAHELEKSLSNSWGSELGVNSAIKTIKNAAKPAAKDDAVKAHSVQALNAADAVEVALIDCEPGPIVTMDSALRKALNDLNGHITIMRLDLGRLADKEDPMKAGKFRAAAATLKELADTIEATLDESPATVRWLDVRNGIPVIKTAPIEVGRRLQEALGNRTLIATSATCAVGGSFDLLANALRLPQSFTVDEDGNQSPRPFSTLDVGTPFDWKASAMLYIPDDGFPEPVGKDRAEHTAAVLEELLTLATAAGGRTLFLSTTTSGASKAAEFLSDRLPVNVYGPGDGTAGQLADWFINDETAILCATMGMWAGLSPVGPTCSLVVIDKIPFPPMDDPLTNARTEAANNRGGNGFMEISVGHAGLMLAQGAGRLIRSASDRGVIAILDRRLLTKRYGSALVRSLPPVGVFSDRAKVESALERLTGGLSVDATKPTRATAPATRKPGAKKTPPSATVKAQKRTKNSWGRGAKAPVTSTRKRSQSTD